MLYPPQARRGRRRRWSNRDNFLNRYAAEAVKGKLETREACASIMAVTTYKANFACLRKGFPWWNTLLEEICILWWMSKNSICKGFLCFIINIWNVSSELLQHARVKYDMHSTPPLSGMIDTSFDHLVSSEFMKSHSRKMEPWMAAPVFWWFYDLISEPRPHHPCLHGALITSN